MSNMSHKAIDVRTLPISQRLFHFMNCMPLHQDIEEWIITFREALRELLGRGNVHRIVVSANTNYGNPYNPDGIFDNPSGSDMAAVTYFANSALPMEIRSYISDGKEYIEKKSSTLLRQMQELGFPFTEYQPPLCFSYHDQDYLGTILLFRYRSPQPIPEYVVEIMEQLHPFIFYALSGAVARRAYAQPVYPIFMNILRERVAELELSHNERLTIALELLAHSRTEIARRLGVSLHSVHKYVQNINRKARSNNLVEIIVRQLAPDFEEKVITEIMETRRAAEGRKKKGDIIQWLHEEDSHGRERGIFIF